MSEHIPEDPTGYAITYTDDGRMAAICLYDGNRLVGVFDTRAAAVAAAVADPGFP